MLYRLVRPLFLFFLLLRYRWQNAQVLHRYRRMCGEALDGLELLPYEPSQVSVCELLSVFRTKRGSLAAADPRHLNTLYQKLLPLEPKRPFAIRSLTSDLALRVERAAVGHVFRRLLGLGPEEKDLDVLQRYGTPSLALCHLLEHCGCPNAAAHLMPLDVELKCFVLQTRKGLSESRSGRGGEGPGGAVAALSARTQPELAKLRKICASWPRDGTATDEDHETRRQESPQRSPSVGSQWEFFGSADRAMRLALVMHMDSCMTAFAIDSAIEHAEIHGRITLDPPATDVIRDLDCNRDDFLMRAGNREGPFVPPRLRTRVLRQTER